MQPPLKQQILPKLNLTAPVTTDSFLTVRRFLSTIFDWALLTLVGLLLWFLTPLQTLSSVFSLPPICIWAGAYFSFFIASSGTTPGKILFGLFVLDNKSNQPVGFVRTLARELIFKPLIIFSLLMASDHFLKPKEAWIRIDTLLVTLFLGSELFIFFRKDGRDLNDVLWRTRTVSTSKHPLIRRFLFRCLSPVKTHPNSKRG